MRKADHTFQFRQRNSDELHKSRKIGEPKAGEILEFRMPRESQRSGKWPVECSTRGPRIQYENRCSHW